jgi:hypothetical protein
MRGLLLVTVVALASVSVAAADQFHAIIIGVDSDKNAIEYRKATSRGFVPSAPYSEPVKASVAGECVIKEGWWYLGKPAGIKEGDSIQNGLKDPILKKASADAPVQCRIHTAVADDNANKIKKGDVIKIIIYTNPNYKKDDKVTN